MMFVRSALVFGLGLVLAWPVAGQEFFDQLVTLPTVATTVGIAARHAMTPAGGADLTDLELEAAVRVTVPLDRPEGTGKEPNVAGLPLGDVEVRSV